MLPSNYREVGIADNSFLFCASLEIKNGGGGGGRERHKIIRTLYTSFNNSNTKTYQKLTGSLYDAIFKQGI